MMDLWWLSFADAAKPRGEQNLGVIITEAESLADAIEKCWRLGINPGGEIMAMWLGPEAEGNVPPRMLDRLLTGAELASIGESNQVLH